MAEITTALSKKELVEFWKFLKKYSGKHDREHNLVLAKIYRLGHHDVDTIGSVMNGDDIEALIYLSQQTIQTLSDQFEECSNHLSKVEEELKDQYQTIFDQKNEIEDLKARNMQLLSKQSRIEQFELPLENDEFESSSESSVPAIGTISILTWGEIDFSLSLSVLEQLPTELYANNALLSCTSDFWPSLEPWEPNFFGKYVQKNIDECERFARIHNSEPDGTKIRCDFWQDTGTNDICANKIICNCGNVGLKFDRIFYACQTKTIQEKEHNVQKSIDSIRRTFMAAKSVINIKNGIYYAICGMNKNGVKKSDILKLGYQQDWYLLSEKIIPFSEMQDILPKYTCRDMDGNLWKPAKFGIFAFVPKDTALDIKLINDNVITISEKNVNYLDTKLLLNEKVQRRALSMSPDRYSFNTYDRICGDA